MFPVRVLSSVPVFAAAALLTGCAGPQPVLYANVDSASYLKPSEEKRTPFSYHTAVRWRDYDRVIIMPVQIYEGEDGQFGALKDDDRRALADYMQASFARALSKRFQAEPTPEAPGAGALRIKLTLTGAATSKPVLSTLAHVDLMGGLYNNVQGVRGREGLMTGWVMYAVEIYDAQSGKLLEAFETKQYPSAFNVAATVGSLAAARTGIDKGAKGLATQLE